MDLGLADRVVLVTGATGGIGVAMARAFAAEGARVALTYASQATRAGELVAELVAERGPGRALGVRYDLTDPASVDAAVAEVERHWGAVDVLVANAMRPPAWAAGQVAFEDVPLAAAGPFLHDNIMSTAQTVARVLPGMRRAGWGRVVLVSTHLVGAGRAGREYYTTAKASLHGLCRSLCWTVGPDGVLINVVCPGLTLTDRVRGLPVELLAAEADATPTGRLSAPADIAAAVLFLSSRTNTNITGQVLTVAGGR